MSDAPTPAPAATARRLLRAADRASLATALEGWPYASLTLVALAPDASPLLLLSDLAEHAKNLKRDPRASLLIDGTAGRDDPAHRPARHRHGRGGRSGRSSVAGALRAAPPLGRALCRLRRFPALPHGGGAGASGRGIGRIDWIEFSALLSPAAPALAAAEADILAHMNADHVATVNLCAQRLLGLAGEGWRLTGVDPEGADLRRAGCVARLDFRAPVGDAEGERGEFVQLAKSARGQG